MQLPDEAVSYHYDALLTPANEDWTPAAELRAKHFLAPARLKELMPRLDQVRSYVAAERGLKDVPSEQLPLDSGFIDLPQQTLDEQRRKGDSSLLGRMAKAATRLRTQVNRVVILGAGGSHLAPRALFEALKSAYHNEMLPEMRLGTPKIYFEGNNFDNDALQELLDLLQTTCVDPEIREERWGVVVISKSGTTLEPAAAYRVMRREAAEYYGARSEWLKNFFVPITGTNGKLRELCNADGFDDDNIFTIPDNVGGRYSVFTPVGLFPAAIMGLDVRAVLQGAAAMTRQFLEEPFERNPVLQYAAVNYLVTQELGKSTRVLAVWSKKLEALGSWYDQLVAESLGKQGRGPTPLTTVATRDLHSRGQHNQHGTRDKLINNLIVKAARTVPIAIGMADRNEDELNTLSRRTYSDMMASALRGTNLSYADVARPTADLILPTLSEHTIGQLMQMLMLATVVEGRLMGVNPYGQPAVDAYRRNMKQYLRS